LGNQPKGEGGSRILPGFSQLRGWEMVFVMGGFKCHKTTSHFLKLPPLFGPLRVKTTIHIGRGGFDLKKREKFTLFEKFPSERGGEGGSGDVGMVSQLFPVFNYESFP